MVIIIVMIKMLLGEVYLILIKILGIMVLLELNKMYTLFLKEKNIKSFIPCFYRERETKKKFLD